MGTETATSRMPKSRIRGRDEGVNEGVNECTAGELRAEVGLMAQLHPTAPSRCRNQFTAKETAALRSSVAERDGDAERTRGCSVPRAPLVSLRAIKSTPPCCALLGAGRRLRSGVVSAPAEPFILARTQGLS